MTLEDTDPWSNNPETNAFPSTELKLRVAGAGASTNPMPSEELRQRRLTAIVKSSPSPQSAEHNSAEHNGAEQQSLPSTASITTTTTTVFSIMAVTERDVQPDARVVVSPPLAGPLLEPLSLPSAAAEVVVARQSAAAAGSTDFTLELGKGRGCCFYYDVSSDNLVAYNDGAEALHLVALETDAADGKFGESVRLARRSVRPLSPGYWRIASDKDGRPSGSLAEFLLLRRRFSVKKSGSSANAGSKRPVADADSGTVAKQSIGLELYLKDNPMLDIRPATKLSVQSPTTLTNSILPSTAETYTISNLRDIVHRTVTMVFRGKHSEFGDTIVKVIKTKDYSPEKHDILQLVRSWKREVEFLKLVTHPSIVRLLGADSRFFTIYMEYLPYPDLASQASKQSYIFQGSLQDSKRILLDMASALDYLATCNILHNDIKPGNIIYDRDRGAVLIDFGLASVVGEGRGGTPYYVPLEAESGARVPASDIFALGVTFLYLLKKIPLPDSTVPVWIIGRYNERWDGWLKKVDEMGNRLQGDGIEGIVARMLKLQVAHRISARGILEELGLPAP